MTNIYYESEDVLCDFIGGYDKVFVITDDNTGRLCLPHIDALNGHVNIEIGAGEHFKNISTVEHIWSELIENRADRKSLVVNLGGGTVSDVGGFAASCFMRGIDYINVPTTLLAMVDASIGGKTGIDFENYKNQIGVFAMPKAVFVFMRFLDTLSEREIVSGLAEMIKYGYIADESLLNVTLDNYSGFVAKAQDIKSKVVEQDFKENGMRKILNFGHTVGHALESCFAETERPLLHGEAIALGMRSALFLSVRRHGLPETILSNYDLIYRRLFKPFALNAVEVDYVLEHIRHDKKTSFGKVCFVLLHNIGEVVFDCDVTDNELSEAVFSLNRL